jgi:hypothetical protein
MVKAQLRKPEIDQWRFAIGRAIERAMTLAGWSLKEFAAAVDRDERQCARWITGGERPQFDALFAVASLRQPLIQAFAELAGVDVEVTVRLRGAG